MSLHISNYIKLRDERLHIQTNVLLSMENLLGIFIP